MYANSYGGIAGQISPNKGLYLCVACEPTFTFYARKVD